MKIPGLEHLGESLPVKNYYGKYFITESGHIVSLYRNKYVIMKSREGIGSYHTIRLCKSMGHPAIIIYVHRYVMTHFTGDRDQTWEVNHIDGDKSNNALSNLEWVRKYRRRGAGKAPVPVTIKGVRYPSISAAMRHYQVGMHVIRRMVKENV